ncbi:hypothetical protein I4U23_006405 [Adineta vaga]|nr:hypothetical protein I4U23_006405 [Adineta vaga]
MRAYLIIIGFVLCIYTASSRPSYMDLDEDNNALAEQDNDEPKLLNLSKESTKDDSNDDNDDDDEWNDNSQNEPEVEEDKNVLNKVINVGFDDTSDEQSELISNDEDSSDDTK